MKEKDRKDRALELARALLKEHAEPEKALLALCFDVVDLAKVAQDLADRNSAFDRTRG
jgi:hypothetical protein